MICVFQGHTKAVQSLAIDATNTRLVSGSQVVSLVMPFYPDFDSAAFYIAFILSIIVTFFVIIIIIIYDNY